MLVVHHLTKYINNKIILKNIDITIKVGSVSVLLGPSGGGKSTLLSCICDVENNYLGEVVCDGENISHPKLGLVPQGLFLWPHLSVRENIYLAAKTLGIYDDSFFLELISLFNIEPLLDKYPYTCSGGEQQRIAIVRQLILKPKYLLLDEITSSLDIKNIQILKSLLQKIKIHTGILLVTHMINFTKSIADYVYFMDHGEIIEQGNIQILKKPSTEKLKDFLSLQ